MRYDLSDKLHRELFKKRTNKLYNTRAIVELREVKARRTLSQNAIFHLWVAVIADAIGEVDREQTKRDVKALLLGYRTTFNRFSGEEQQTEHRTRDLTKEQMSDFLTRLKAWADTDMGIYLPSPEDVGFAEMQERYG